MGLDMDKVLYVLASECGVGVYRADVAVVDRDRGRVAIYVGDTVVEVVVEGSDRAIVVVSRIVGGHTVGREASEVEVVARRVVAEVVECRLSSYGYSQLSAVLGVDRGGDRGDRGNG